MQIVFTQYRQLSIGQSLYLIGNIPELGEWDIYKSKRLDYYHQNIWKITLLMPEDITIEYKYFIAQTDNINNIQWDQGQNRILDSRIKTSQEIMTFNIRYDNNKDKQNSWIYRKEQVVNLVQKINAQIIGFPRSFISLKLRFNQLPNYKQIWRGSQIQFNKGVGLPKYDYIKQEIFWLSDTPNIAGSKTYGNYLPRICKYVQLQNKENNKIFNIYNTHYDHENMESQKKSSLQIKKHIQQNFQQDQCIFVMGDLNALTLSEPIKILEKNDLKLQNTINLIDILQATFHRFKRILLGNHIDYIFTYNLQLIKMDIIRDKTDRYPSDHFPKFIEYN